MKNYRLYILTCGFLLLLLQPGNAFSAGKTSFSRTNEVAVSSIHLPHTELELHGNQWTNAAGSSYRLQGGNAALPDSEFRLAHVPCLLATATDARDNLSFKDYLFHIYPSHNFW